MKISIRGREQLTADWCRYWVNGIEERVYTYQGELWAAPPYKEELALLGYIRKEFARTKVEQARISKAEEDVRWLINATGDF
jgi:hypothetical protein